MKLIGNNVVLGEHESLGVSYQYACTDEAGNTPELIWTENETNSEKIFGQPLDTPYVKMLYVDVSRDHSVIYIRQCHTI